MVQDTEEMKFFLRWYLSDDAASMETLRENNCDEFTFFSIKWGAYGDANRRTLSPDTIFVEINALLTLTVALPHVQLHKTTSVSVFELIN